MTGSPLRAVAPETRIVGGNLTPAQDALALLGGNVRKQVLNLTSLVRILREEHHANAVGTRLRQDDAQTVGFCPEESVWQLNEDPSSVSRIDLAPTGATVEQVDDHLECLLHERV